MARRPNYGAEKRSKELGKQKKREEKEEKKRARREAELAASEVTGDGEMEAGGLMRAEAMRDDEDGGKDLFVHHSAIQASGFRSLGEGDRVEFDAVEGPKGPSAENVARLG